MGMSDTLRWYPLYRCVTKVRPFDPHTVSREDRMTQDGPLIRPKSTEFSDGLKIWLQWIMIRVDPDIDHLRLRASRILQWGLFLRKNPRNRIRVLHAGLHRGHS